MTGGLGAKGELEQDVYDAFSEPSTNGRCHCTDNARKLLMIVLYDSASRCAEIELTSQPRREQRLKEAVKKIKDDYDYIPLSTAHLH